jgi:hypothetical protein
VRPGLKPRHRGRFRLAQAMPSAKAAWKLSGLGLHDLHPNHPFEVRVEAKLRRHSIIHCLRRFMNATCLRSHSVIRGTLFIHLKGTAITTNLI